MRHPPAVPEAYWVLIPAGMNHAEFRVFSATPPRVKVALRAARALTRRGAACCTRMRRIARLALQTRRIRPLYPSRETTWVVRASKLRIPPSASLSTIP